MSNCNGHEWAVFSTCVTTGELMCQCVNCGAFGVVQEPTHEEWCKAFYAPERPYRWTQDSRVVIKQSHVDEMYVVRNGAK